MKNFFIAVVALIGLQSCSSDSDAFNTDNANQETFQSIKIVSHQSNDESKLSSTPIYRFYSSVYNQHYFSTGDFLPSYFQEGIIGYVSSSPGPNITTIWYNSNNGDSFITTNAAEVEGKPGWIKKATLGSADFSLPTFPVHRYYRSSTNSHFFTTNFSELGNGKNGFVYEGIGFYVN